MPFTPAHAIVALPFVRSRRWSAAAIACGAIAPDLPLFFAGGVGYGQTHALWAVPTLDVVLGLVCLAVWWGLARPGVLAVLPRAIRTRVGPRAPAVPALLPVGVAAGALTHVVWDAFTHRGRFGSTLLPVLDERVGPFALTSWAQYASGAIGVTVLAVAALRAFRRADVRAARGPSPLGRLATPVGVSVLALAAVWVTAVTGFGAGLPTRSGWVFAAATASIATVAAGLTVVGAVVRVRERRSAA